MPLLRAIILGIIQGATEFLPVSSSGHLVLIPWLLNWETAGATSLAFDSMLHLGTVVAVLAFFWSDLIQIAIAMLRGISKRRPLGTPQARLGWYILLASIPAAIAGFFLEDWFASLFDSPLTVALALLVTAALLVISERVGKRVRELDQLTAPHALLIGVAQALAIIPGISRSGATISAGLTCGQKRPAATRFSFLLGVPVIVGAGLLQTYKLLSATSGIPVASALAGFLAAALTGYLAIRTLLRYVRNHTLDLFAAYCLAFGLLCLVVYALRT